MAHVRLMSTRVTRTVASAVGLLAVAALPLGCADHMVPSVAIFQSDRVASIYLIGDAGSATLDDAVLAELIRDVSGAPIDRAVVFLGDNVYPRGLPSAEPGNSVDEQAHLDAQVRVARDSKVRTIFVPGNHDWAKSGQDGWRRIQESGKFIALRGGGFASQRPSDGCPGPEIQDVGQSIRLIFIDTQWWLHKASYPKPPGNGSNCPANSQDEVVQMLALRLKEASAAGRQAIVTAHHPLTTAGPHAGSASLMNHLFPLRGLKKSLWIPLPVIGSVYQLTLGRATAQDLPSDTNTSMRRSLETSMAANPPLLFAAGHDHSLQVFRGPTARFSVVSGAGSTNHQTAVGWTPSTLYASSRAGYMRVDVLKNGAVRLSVIEVTSAAASHDQPAKWKVREAASLWLSEPGRR